MFGVLSEAGKLYVDDSSQASDKGIKEAVAFDSRWGEEDFVAAGGYFGVIDREAEKFWLEQYAKGDEDWEKGKSLGCDQCEQTFGTAQALTNHEEAVGHGHADDDE